MKASRILFCSVALFCAQVLFLGCRRDRHEEKVSQLSSEDISWIRRMEAEHEALAAKADFDTMAHTFSEDVVFMAPNLPDIVGRARLREWQKQFTPMKDYKLAILEITGSGDVAYVRGTYQLTFTPAGSNQEVTDSGRWLHILKKQPDKSWLITRDIFSSDRPLPAP